MGCDVAAAAVCFGSAFITAIAIFLVQSKVLMSAYEAMRLRQNGEALALQMDIQKHDYESV